MKTLLNGGNKQIKWRRLWACLLVMAVLAAGFSGCGVKEAGKVKDAGQASAESNAQAGGDSQQDDGAQTDSKDAKGGSDEARSFTDDCGRTVEVPGDLTQVVASGNLAQIIIYAIAPDTLMAIPGKYSKEASKYIPKEYRDLPEIGSFFGSHDLNYEEIAKLGPQMVIDVGEDKPSMKADLDDITNKTGITAVHIDADYNTMDEAFVKLGELFDRQEEGQALADYCAQAYADMEQVTKAVKKKKTVMYCTQEDGLNVLARNSYHSQIVDQLGENVVDLDDPSSQGTGNEVNMEQMLLWDPEVIIFAPQSYYDYVADDPSWGSLSAVKSGDYYEVPFGPYNWMGSPPSSNRIIGMYWMAKLLYPEQATFDMQEKAKQYYDLFYHYDLSEKEYKKLVKHSLGK